MFKKVEAEVVKRNASRKPLYIVIVREYRTILGRRIWEGPWKDTGCAFFSRTQAMKLKLHIKDYLKGKYKPNEE